MALIIHSLVFACTLGLALALAAIDNSGFVVAGGDSRGGLRQIVPTLADITSAMFSAEGTAVASSCDHVCTEGGCLFEYCLGASPREDDAEEEEPVAKLGAQCPGGACSFKHCANPTCDGGLCTFDHCPGATCNGGACNFFNHPETLRRGYCAGERCSLHGRPHPGFDGHLSI